MRSAPCASRRRSSVRPRRPRRRRGRIRRRRSRRRPVRSRKIPARQMLADAADPLEVSQQVARNGAEASGSRPKPSASPAAGGGRPGASCTRGRCPDRPRRARSSWPAPPTVHRSDGARSERRVRPGRRRRARTRPSALRRAGPRSRRPSGAARRCPPGRRAARRRRTTAGIWARSADTSRATGSSNRLAVAGSTARTTASA